MTKFEQIIIAMLIIFLFIINPFSWIVYFDQDGYLGPANFVIILLFDFLFILLIVLSFYYKDMKFVLKLLSFNLFGVLVCCLIIDAIFGSWFSRESIRELWIPSNQVYKIDLKNIYPYEKDYIINKRDKYGFRGNYRSPNTINILTIGGSTTAQLYINEGETWQDILADQFRQNGQNVQVVNAGVDGQSTFGHINNFYEWFPLIPNLKPQYILYYIGINDYFRDDGNSYDDLSINRRLGKNIIHDIKQKIKRKSIIYNLFRTFRGLYLASAYGLTHDLDYKFTMNDWTDEPLITNYDTLLGNKLNTYKIRVLKLCEQAREYGSQPIFMTQTTRRYYKQGTYITGETQSVGIHTSIDRGIKYMYNGVQYNGVDFYYMLKLINEKTIEAAKECGALAIDLSTDLQEEFNIWDDYYDAVHNTPKGTKRIGVYLFNKLNGLIKQL